LIVINPPSQRLTGPSETGCVVGGAHVLFCPSRFPRPKALSFKMGFAIAKN